MVLALVDFDACNYNEACAMKKQYKAYINKCKKNKVAPTLEEKDFTKIDSMKKLVS